MMNDQQVGVIAAFLLGLGTGVCSIYFFLSYAMQRLGTLVQKLLNLSTPQFSRLMDQPFGVAMPLNDEATLPSARPSDIAGIRAQFNLSDDALIRLVMPSICKECLPGNAMASTTYSFISAEDNGVVCVIHGLLFRFEGEQKATQ